MSAPGFRRLILELGVGATGPSSPREAAAFAKSLGLELLAVFVEDEALLHASALPFSREIDPVTHRWRPLEPERLENEMRAAAAWARERFSTAAKEAGIPETFEIRRGDPGPLAAGLCVETDIVAVSPSRIGGATHGFQRLTATAQGSPAAVLWLPPNAAPRRGPIVAAAADAADPCIAAARQIAERIGEVLAVAMPRGGDYPVAGVSAEELAGALNDAGERMIALSRTGPFGEVAAELSARRGVPVLVLE